MTNDRKDRLEKIAELVGLSMAQGNVGAQATNTASIGTPDTSVDAYLGAESLRWLKAQIGTEGTAYLDTVELETADGTLVFESDSPIEVSFKEDE